MGRTRVVHLGTGMTGTFGLKGILDDPTLDLIGWWVSSPQKEGVDAGTYCKRDPVGVLGTRDIEAILALKPDCLLYGASAATRDEAAVADMARFLEKGINVVTFVLESMSYPPAAPARLRDVIEAACRKGGSTFYATGSEPGLFTLPLPAVLLSGLGKIRSYREQQFALDFAGVYPVEHALRESMGFGKPSGTMPPRIQGGTVERWWGPNLHAIAAMLNVKIEKIELVWETADTPVEIDTAVGKFGAGTVAAYRWDLRGFVNGKPAICVEYIAQLVPSVKIPDHWPRLGPDKTGGAIVYDIEGDPGLRVEVQTKDYEGISGSVAMTALHCVNAIPHVVAADGGIIHALQLPYYTPRVPAFT